MRRFSRSQQELTLNLKETEGSGKRLKILLADDEPFNLIVLEGSIRQIEPRAVIHQALNGKIAYDMMIDSIEAQYDIVFLDNFMPVMSGYELASKIRTTQCTKNVKVVLVSGDGLDSTKNYINDASGCVKLFNHSLLKPFQSEDLRRIIAR
ncbi:hypothetical protein FGO68_gene16190 [Halteria grandinella]|uniref:Response regulatory domain-containing protein n=1 Tax=Halteria grandinella TaxID=5974 RepID=A0A8J8NBH4_HALGN|nr:hypothetical protein FGO68_gene16190 [Halteria grandinella]